MRLKTYLATYLLFLCLLFTSVGIVTVYMTTNQMNMLKEKSAGQYQTIVHSLSRDMAVLYGRSMNDADFSMAVENLVSGYARYYRRQNINLSITNLSGQEVRPADAEVSFISREYGDFIAISGVLPGRFGYFRLDYSLDATQNIADMRGIQNILMLSAVVFSIVAAFALYFILSSIFRPLAIVAKSSRSIASGHYSERIRIKGKNELAAMAQDFNRMAEKIEKQIRLLEEEAVRKQRFVDNFSHEIRTPLTSIYGYAEYLQKAALSEEEVIESAQFIMDEARHMRQIASSLLKLATLRGYTPVKSKISVQQLFEDISGTMRNSFDEHKVQLICRGNADTLDGQEDLIKVLLLNLCANALSACSPGKGEVYLETAEQGKAVVLSVTDNGHGIPHESVSEIMEPFYRVDKARSREDGGAGLGLALCKQIADAHGAAIAIESAPGAGTKIILTFTSS